MKMTLQGKTALDMLTTLTCTVKHRSWSKAAVPDSTSYTDQLCSPCLMHVFPSIAQAMSPSDHEDENDPDGPFAFRRRKACNYYAVSEFGLAAFSLGQVVEGLLTCWLMQMVSC